MRKSLLAIAFAASILPAVPAMADDDRWRGEREYRRTDNGIRYWQGEDGRTYCRKPNGTTGILIGGVAGALIGRSIDTRGDRAVGTILGAAGGALIGRAIERGSARCR